MDKKMYFLAILVLGLGILISSPVPASGNITVSSIPSGSSVFVDDISTGTITPTTIEGVTSGTHYVLLPLTGYQDFTQSVSVSNNAK
jgi:hypothetical protein